MMMMTTTPETPPPMYAPAISPFLLPCCPPALDLSDAPNKLNSGSVLKIEAYSYRRLIV